MFNVVRHSNDGTVLLRYIPAEIEFIIFIELV